MTPLARIELRERKDSGDAAYLGWPGPGKIVLVVMDGGAYIDSMRDLAGRLDAVFDSGVVVCANRPHQAVRRNAPDEVDMDRFQYLDCVTCLTGLQPPRQPGVHFIESPTMLEKISMRTMQMLKRVDGRRFVLVDSLSTLAMYSDVRTVAELVHHLVTHLRRQGVGAALVLVQRQAPEGLMDAVRPHVDDVVHY